ncbi:catechol 2,3-dioxygenase-like lactoylglutathione lyase family enzyme [Bradyrhizobium sp. i1.3.6]
MPVKVEALDHLVINVADVAVTSEWYRKILGMEVKVFDPGGGKAPRTSLQFGNQKINVRPRDADKVEWFTADHQTAGSEDLCFLTSASPDEVVAHLEGTWRRDRGRPGSQAGCPRHAALGLLQGSGWQPD